MDDDGWEGLPFALLFAADDARSGHPISPRPGSYTSIEMPTSHYDPKGKFAKYNFPSHITKDEAIALMQKPPRPGDPLPIPG